MSRRLWIVDPSLYVAEEEGVAAILEGWGGESRVFRPALRPGDGPGPATGHDADGVVIMGSAASVHDPYPWIDDLSRWLAPVLDGTIRVPLLAICFGHQLVAHLAGGEVGFLREDRGKRTGVESASLEGSRLLENRARLRVVVSHCEEVKRAPAGYRTVGRREHVAVDALENERGDVFAFQFHPEARADFARRAGLSPEVIDARVLEDSRALLGAFRARVRGS